MPRRYKRRIKRSKRRMKKSMGIGKYYSFKTTGAPRSIRVKLKYSEVVPLATLAFDEHVFAGNSVYDCNVTGTGHQAMGHDQFSSLYNRFRVHASKIEAQFVAQSSNTNTAAIVGVAPMVTNTGPTTLDQARERDHAKCRFVAASGGSPAGRKVVSYMSTAHALGISKQSARGNNSLQALISADPADLWYWTVFGGTIDQTTAINQQVLVTITYYVEYFDKVPLAQS